jgi:peptidylprolyl isomerase
MRLITSALLSAVFAGTAMAAPRPPPASLIAQPPAVPAPPAETDWRTPDPQNVLVIDTSKGRVFFEMAPAIAPLSVARVRDLARTGFYDGRAFFRVIDNFMDQTGDPKDNGTGGSTLPNLPPEFIFRRSSDMPFTPVSKTGGRETGFIGSAPVISQAMDLGLLTADNKVGAYVTFCPGVGGLARAEAPDSANSQFFLMRGSNTALDQKYTPWGRVIAGLDVVRAIKVGEPPPPPADTVVTVKVLADLPAATRPVVRVIDTGSPWFSAMVERVRTEKIIEFSLCDLELPSQVVSANSPASPAPRPQ